MKETILFGVSTRPRSSASAYLYTDQKSLNKPVPQHFLQGTSASLMPLLVGNTKRKNNIPHLVLLTYRLHQQLEQHLLSERHDRASTGY